MMLRLARAGIHAHLRDAASAHLTAARALSAPEVFADLLRADPELSRLHADPRWPGLLGE